MPALVEEPPEGFGSFSLIVENAARTILPPAPTTDNFAAYTLAFTATSGGENKSEDRTNANYSSPVILAVGTYNLIVSAYLDAEKTRLAASGKLEGIVIGPGANAFGSVTLKTLSDTGNGTFTYNVTISAPGVTDATMVITKNGTTVSTVTLTNSGLTTASPTLDSGVYNIHFTLIKEGAEEAIWNEILYIRAELTSSFSITFNDDFFYRTHYNVTFVYNDEGATANTQQSVAHNGTLTAPTPTRTGYTFEGWHTDSDLTTAYVSAPVLSDFTLYAKWEESRGTEDNPFIVDTETKLRYVGRGTANTDPAYQDWTLNKYYKQTADITLEEGDWTAIGSFTGTYNGDGHTITGLIINALSYRQGMFSYIDTSGRVENLSLIDVTIVSTSTNIGGIAGTNQGTIQNCYVSGSVTGSGYVGGIAGASGRTIQNCYVNGNVTGSGTDNRAGGITGSNSGTIQNCYVSGNVTGSSQVGGITGNNSGTIQNCYVSGNVTGTSSYAGGIAANNSSGTIQNCYVTSSVMGSANVGGIAGDAGTIRNCVALNETVTLTSTTTSIGRISGVTTGTRQNNYAWSGMVVRITTGLNTPAPDATTTGKDGQSITAAAAKTAATWTTVGNWNTGGIGAWDFTTVWQWNANGMPSLRSVGTVQPWPDYLVDPGITPDNPILVNNETDLRRVGRGNVNPDGYKDWTSSAHYRQTADIILGSTDWTPINAVEQGVGNFTGSYNGDGHTITGLKLSATTNQRRGMFASIGTGGMVENLGLISVNISSNIFRVGGIAGENNGTIQNCYVSGTVTGTYELGGIAGNNYGTIQNCYSSASVTGSQYSIGGISGENTGTMQNCYVSGTVSGNNNNIGGIAANNTGTIRNCVALNRRVTYTAMVGAPGRITGNTTGTRQNNYAWSGMEMIVYSNPVTPTAATATGKDGQNITAVEAKDNSWWTTNTTWDFSGVWQLNSTSGMPSLRVFGTVPPWPDYLVDPYTVTYNINGGSGTTPAAQTVTVGSSVTLNNGSGLTRTGYTFDGWNTQADGNGTNYAAGSSYTPTAGVTLYAKWNINTYTVSFESNGGSAVGNITNVTHGSTITAPTAPTRTGYTFAGWYKESTFTNQWVFATDTVTSTTTLYARWTSTVTYNLNNATSGTTPTAQTVNAGSSVTLNNGSGIARTGYTFAGWNTQADGNGTNYTAGSSYTPTASVTLYAKWTYTVTFNGNGQTSAAGTVPAAITANAGEGITIPVQGSLARTNYTFGGWNTQADGTGTGYAAGASQTFTASVTLYAKWEANPPTGTPVPGSTLADKLAWLSTNAVSNTDYIIEVTANEAIGPQTLTYSGRSNIKIILWGSGGEKVVSLSSNGTLFNVPSGVTLVLYSNITLQGRSNNNNSLVWVNPGGAMEMNMNTKISGNTYANSGAGVYMQGGTFTMNGGEISGNTASTNAGGGVFMQDGTFTMNGGKISGNTAGNNGGGGVCVYGGTFAMNGGKISGNTTSGSGGGVAITGNASTIGGTFIMNGGEISGNTSGGGVYMSAPAAIFRIVTGTVYGATESDTALKNTGGALFINSGTAQRGTFSIPGDVTSTWTSKGSLSTSTITINVSNGDLVP